VNDRFVRLAELRRVYVPVSAATIWRWVKAGTFPKPVKLGERVTAWKLQEVQEWMRSKAAIRNQEEA
jgi:prophage regulatory protein